MNQSGFGSRSARITRIYGVRIQEKIWVEFEIDFWVWVICISMHTENVGDFVLQYVQDTKQI